MTATLLKCLCGLALATAAVPALATAPAMNTAGVVIPTGLRIALAHSLSARSGVPHAPADIGWTEQEVLSSDGAAGDVFGYSVAIDGDTALVGAAQGANGDGGSDDGLPGAVYVFHRTATGWVEVQKLTPDDGVDNDQFGYSVALEGATALVGVPFATVDDNAGRGAVYVFTLEGDTWSQSQKLVADDGAMSDQLGWSVALDGDTALLGAPGAADGGDFATGAAYVFVRSGGDFAQSAKLTADDGVGADDFGFGVAIKGSTAILTSANSSGGVGSGYVFTFDGTTWTQASKLLADDGTGTDTLGYSVAFDGTTALLGAPFATVGANPFQGAVYAFQANPDRTWSQTQKIVASEGLPFDAFGISTTVSGDDLLVTAPFYNGGQGEAFLFSNAAGGDFVEDHVFTASDAGDNPGQGFGYSGAISEGTALIGSVFNAPGGNVHQGAAYFYTPSLPDAIFGDGFDG
ncbi:MAG TPA: hypothetical protein VJ724_02880 [Tahibacter sp.]|nr:hypothetical protein [Tahibacter sp.]